MTAEMAEYRLDRTGRAPLAFSGEFLARSSGEEFLENRRGNPRWHDLELYKTRGGRYVLWVRYHSDWEGEDGHDDAAVLEDAAGVRDALANWPAEAPVAGYPPGERFAARQARLLADVRARFDRTVSEMFAQLGAEFAERVE